MFDQDAQESLHAPKGSPVDHYRPVRLVVWADVFEPKPLGKQVVELDRAKLPLAADAIPDDEVGLGAVEGGLAWGFLVGLPHPVEHGSNVFLGATPCLARGALVFGVGRIVLRES